MSATGVAATPPEHARRRRIILVPVALLAVIGLGLAYLFVTAKPERSVPLGASASVPGGMASISEIVPVENDGWEPDDDDDAFDAPPPAGSHRVRLVVRATALEPGGMRLDTRKFSISGLGRDVFRPVWQSPPMTDLEQGASVKATLVFEVPDQAVALVLDGPGGSRLSLGLSHHTP